MGRDAQLERRSARRAGVGRRIRRRGAVLLVSAALGAVPLAPGAAMPPTERFPGRRGDGAAWIGRRAPSLEIATWLDGQPREIDEAAGRVVLVRFWTDTCPFCETTAPVLREFDARYRERGLQVLGVFHPKPSGDGDVERARRAAERFDFAFPVGVDADWTALRRWWLDGQPGGWTSVTFLVDRSGVIRYVHPGGEFHPGAGGAHWPDHAACNAEYIEIVDTIERLLAEPAPPTAR